MRTLFLATAPSNVPFSTTEDSTATSSRRRMMPPYLNSGPYHLDGEHQDFYRAKLTALEEMRNLEDGYFARGAPKFTYCFKIKRVKVVQNLGLRLPTKNKKNSVVIKSCHMIGSGRRPCPAE